MHKNYFPLVKAIPWQDPAKIFHLFAERRGAIFLDSARLMQNCGRYSFIGVDPFLIMGDEAEPFGELKKKLAEFPLGVHEDLPPFQGGVAGYWGYDLCHYLEKIPHPRVDDMQFPNMWVGFYDLVLAFDHELKQAWIFSSGYPEQNIRRREARAKERCQYVLEQIEHVPALPEIMGPFCQPDDIISNVTRAEYLWSVQKVIDYILAGDIFQANISQRFSAPLSADVLPYALYCRLRAMNPAPFAGYFNAGETILASASPERFLHLAQGHVETRPIKGTRSRGKTLAEDAAQANELLRSEKDRAENVMIVDLLRNDLSRVCADHSVKVPVLCGLESYATVHHLVSVVTGKLRVGQTAVDLLQATFPGGSITGAPKVRAMEIIAEIEAHRRGPYCGSLGYIGFDGSMDSSILIRSYAIKNSQITFQTGGAIVADSDPAAEYEETLLKAKVLYDVLLSKM